MQKDTSLESRSKRSHELRVQYPDKVPVILVRSIRPGTPELSKYQFIIPCSMTMANFGCVVKRYIIAGAEISLFFLINGKHISTNATIGTLDTIEFSPDGFLYIEYRTENAFG